MVPKALLSKPSVVADPVLHQQAVAACQRQLDEIRASEMQNGSLTTEERVASLMAENPGRLWSLGEVAAKLHISPRTLIRRLDAEGTKFQRVRDELAKKQVINYLTEASLSVESVGHLMGFSDTSSFRRSFKRWFGETPAQYLARTRRN
jgi:AraC-like DNA-binding protein